MAFNVTPTSGEGPYTFTATIDAPRSFESNRYSLLFQSTTAVGSCPPLGSSGNLPGGASSILATGTYTSDSSFNVGSCRAYSLRIRDNVTNAFIDESTVQVSRLD